MLSSKAFSLAIIILSMLSLTSSSSQSCFSGNVSPVPVNCTLEKRPKCDADSPVGEGTWAEDQIRNLRVSNRTTNNSRIFDLNWMINSIGGTYFVPYLQGIQIKVTGNSGAGSSPPTLSCDKLVFNGSEVDNEFDLLNSVFQYRLDCKEAGLMDQLINVTIRLLPLQSSAVAMGETRRLNCVPPKPLSFLERRARQLINAFFVSGQPVVEPASFDGVGRLSLPLFDGFSHFPHYKVIKVFVVDGDNVAYNFYGEKVKPCNIYPANVKSDDSYPCDELFKYLTPGSYSLFFRFYNSTAIDGSSADMVESDLTVRADRYENHVSSANLTIDSSTDAFNITFPVAPRHLNLPNRYDLEVRLATPSVGRMFSFKNITAGDVSRYWQNGFFHVGELGMWEGKNLSVTLVVWTVDSSVIFNTECQLKLKPINGGHGPITAQKSKNWIIAAVAVPVTLFAIIGFVVLCRRHLSKPHNRGQCTFHSNASDQSSTSSRSELSQNILLCSSSQRYRVVMWKLQEILKHCGSQSVTLSEENGFDDLKEHTGYVILHSQTDTSTSQLNQSLNNNQDNVFHIVFHSERDPPMPLDPHDLLQLPDNLADLLKKLGLPTDNTKQYQMELRQTLLSPHLQNGSLPHEPVSASPYRSPIGPSVGSDGSLAPLIDSPQSTVTPPISQNEVDCELGETNHRTYNGLSIEDWVESAGQEPSRLEVSGDNDSLHSYCTELPDGPTESHTCSVPWSQDQERPTLDGESVHKIVSPPYIMLPDKLTGQQSTAAQNVVPYTQSQTPHQKTANGIGSSASFFSC